MRKRENYYFEGLILQNICSEVLVALEEVYGIDQELYLEYYESDSQVIITSIDEESQSAELDLHFADYITHVDGKKIRTIKDFDQQLKNHQNLIPAIRN